MIHRCMVASQVYGSSQCKENTLYCIVYGAPKGRGGGSSGRDASLVFGDLFLLGRHWDEV